MDETTVTPSQILDNEKPAVSRMRPESRLIYRRAFMMGQVAMVDELKKSMDEKDHWQYIATHDELTGLLNRRGFMLRCDEVRLEHPDQHNLAIAAIDLDKLKFFNDKYGHPVGDEYLKFFSKFLDDHIRKNDVKARSIAGRVGGDEYYLVIDLTPREEEEIAVDPAVSRAAFEVRLRDEFDAALVAEETDPRFKISSGFSIGFAFCEEGKSTEELLKIADANMYSDKRRRGIDRG